MPADFVSQNAFLDHLRVRIVAFGQKSFITLWFIEDFERILEHLWQHRPSEAFYLHEHAVQTLQFHLQYYLPEIIHHGCAPVPPPDEKLNSALEKMDLHVHQTGQLNREYSTITFWPWSGGCSCCFLKTDCRKGSMIQNEHLPPYFPP